MTDRSVRAEDQPVLANPAAESLPSAAVSTVTPPPNFRRIFEAESSYVLRTLHRLGVQERDVEDLAHEVFITVHRRLPDYDASRPLRPWIFGIALRTAMRYREPAVEASLESIP